MCVLLFAACSGSSDSMSRDEPINFIAQADELDDDTIADNLPGVSDPLPEVLARLKSESGLLAPVPEVQFTRTMADTGIQVSYTELSLVPLAPGEVIQAQWKFMQECVQQVGVAPVVLVTQDQVAPFTENDDVVRNQVLTATEILSIPIASASTLHGNLVQIRIDDFDGSLGSSLFNLRSIMGRMVWLENGLPVRDYPHDCAQFSM